MKPKNLPPLSPGGDNQNPDMETYFKTLQETDYTGSFPQTAAWVRQRHYSTAAAVSWLQTLRLFLFGRNHTLAVGGADNVNVYPSKALLVQLSFHGFFQVGIRDIRYIHFYF